MKNKDSALKLYAARLHARVNEASVLNWADLSIGDWRPIENDCHGNVTTLCERDQSYVPIRGWLYFDFGGMSDRVKFLAHSAVRGPDGVLYDITPSCASRQYPFICAEESEDDYAQLVEGDGIVNLWHIK